MMGVARSSFYDAAGADMDDDAALVARMQAVQDECPSYGYRRITAELRAQGTLANHKRVARLMLSAAVKKRAYPARLHC